MGRKISPGSTQEQEEPLHDYVSRIQRADQLGDLLASLPKWIALVIIAWQAALSIIALSGRDSLSAFLVRFGRETSYWELICWGAGLLGILFGLYTGHLLHRRTAEDFSRLEALDGRLRLMQNAPPPSNSASSKSSRED
jgi:hypothetical protein